VRCLPRMIDRYCNLLLTSGSFWQISYDSCTLTHDMQLVSQLWCLEEAALQTCQYVVVFHDINGLTSRSRHKPPGSKLLVCLRAKNESNNVYMMSTRPPGVRSSKDGSCTQRLQFVIVSLCCVTL